MLLITLEIQKGFNYYKKKIMSSAFPASQLGKECCSRLVCSPENSGAMKGLLVDLQRGAGSLPDRDHRSKSIVLVPFRRERISRN